MRPCVIWARSTHMRATSSMSPLWPERVRSLNGFLPPNTSDFLALRWRSYACILPETAEEIASAARESLRA